MIVLSLEISYSLKIIIDLYGAVFFDFVLTFCIYYFYDFIILKNFKLFIEIKNKILINHRTWFYLLFDIFYYASADGCDASFYFSLKKNVIYTTVL